MLPSGRTGEPVVSLRVVSYRTVYHYSVCVDSSPQRAVHALDHCPCVTDPKLGLGGGDCGSVHYGLCSALTLPPAVDIQALQTLTPIVAKAESYRDKIQAAIELLAVEEEPKDLETLLRNFVIEDKRRQESRQQSAPELDSKGSKKIIIRSHSQFDVINNRHNDGSTNDHNTGGPGDRGSVGGGFGDYSRDRTSQSLVRSRLSKFDTERSRSLSPSPKSRVREPSSPSVEPYPSSSSSSLLSSPTPSSEKLVFGISPKTQSLSRYKSLIESRNNGCHSSAQSSSASPSLNPSSESVGCDNQKSLFKDDDRRQQSQQTIHARSSGSNSDSITPVRSGGGVGPKIDDNSLSSAQSPTNSSVPALVRSSHSSALTLSVIDSQTKSTLDEQTTNSYSFSSSSLSSYSSPQSVTNVLNSNTVQMSPSPVKTVTTSPASSAKVVQRSTQLNNDSPINGRNGTKSRPLSAPESTLKEFIVHQLTDDEKAVLVKNSRNGNAKDDNRPVSADSSNGNSTNGNVNRLKPVIDKPKPRIITLSKPLPKPEPKAAEPKYVNGKLVFGQIPVKPFLAKGSVAERVLMFEKCPEKTSVTKLKKSDKRDKFLNNKVNKVGQWMKLNDNNCTDNFNNNNNKQNEIISRRFSRSNSLNSGCLPGQLPKFYYPLGRPYSSHEVETQIRKITAVFDRFPARIVGRKELGAILKIVGLPLYWKEPVFRAVNNSNININNNNNNNNINNGNGNGKKDVISCEAFVDYWKKVISTCYDNASRFVKILTSGQRNYLLPEDFGPMIQDVIDTHPGLAFLKEAEEFHSRYVHTVIARIFYCVNQSWTGRISLPELKKSNFLQVVSLLEEEDDINQITDYFSYEHFYVIYCKFWELDKDHDLFISKADLSRHNDSAISSRMIDRIFSGAVTRGQTRKDGLMSYSEFVWFILSEEDKRHPRSIEYWFRCIDLDGDGFLSMYELEYFYSEQTKRMEAIGIEALPFNDCLCQMLDLVRPQQTGRISLSDLKRCRLTPIFFDTFFNLEKYLDHEQRDPFASNRDEDGLTMSDWDRFAAEEYELLVAEESAQQNTQNLLDFTGESGFNDYLIASGKYGIRARSAHPVGDDDYDYADIADDGSDCVY